MSEQDRIKLAEALVQEGRSARRYGVPITKCPPFKIEEWADDWRRGWRDEDERRNK